MSRDVKRDRLSPLGIVCLIMQTHGFTNADVFRSHDAGWIISGPGTNTTWFVSNAGQIRAGQLSGWRDFSVVDV